MVAAELAPYVRATSASETIAALAKAERQLGHDVTIAVPRYPAFEQSGLLLARQLSPLELPGGGEVTVCDGQLASGVKLVLFDLPDIEERPDPYSPKDRKGDAARYGLFARAVVALTAHRAEQGSRFEVAHLHDWGAGLFAVAQAGADVRAPTVLTIHDVSSHQAFSKAETQALGFSKEQLSGNVKAGAFDALAAAIGSSDVVTTVSPSYGAELASVEKSGAVAEALADREVMGVTNGIDYSIYNPATDAALAVRYDAEGHESKGSSKTALLRELGLDLETNRPVVACVGPFSEDSGADIVLAALPALLKNDVSLVLAGAAPAALEKKLSAAAKKHEDALAFVGAPNDALLHRVYAGADMMLVPARHSPCGEIQLIAQRYGALPVAHAVGGIRDTVVDCDAELETGTGFLFDEPNKTALMSAVQRALAAYGSSRWPDLVRRVMHVDLGWDRPARRYLQLYRQAASDD